MLKSPSGKIYIGQTKHSIEKRFQQHQKESSKCLAIRRAVKKYGWKNLEKDWYECPDEDLNFDEELLVKELGTLAPGGYNLKGGGDNCGELSEETRQKMSESQKGDKSHMFGKTRTDEEKQKMSEAQKGEKNHMFGKTHTINSRQQHSESIKGEKNHRSKRVYQYDLEGKLLGSFASAGEAGRYLKKHESSINACARGVKGYKTAYGFKWSWSV